MSLRHTLLLRFCTVRCVECVHGQRGAAGGAAGGVGQITLPLLLSLSST